MFSESVLVRIFVPRLGERTTLRIGLACFALQVRRHRRTNTPPPLGRCPTTARSTNRKPPRLYEPPRTREPSVAHARPPRRACGGRRPRFVAHSAAVSFALPPSAVCRPPRRRRRRSAQTALLAVAHSRAMVFLSVVPSLGSNLVYPSIMSLVSRSVSAEMQGEAQGAVNGVKAVTEGIGPLGFAFLLSLFEVVFLSNAERTHTTCRPCPPRARTCAADRTPPPPSDVSFSPPRATLCARKGEVERRIARGGGECSSTGLPPPILRLRRLTFVASSVCGVRCGLRRRGGRGVVVSSIVCGSSQPATSNDLPLRPPFPRPETVAPAVARARARARAAAAARTRARTRRCPARRTSSRAGSCSSRSRSRTRSVEMASHLRIATLTGS